MPALTRLFSCHVRTTTTTTTTTTATTTITFVAILAQVAMLVRSTPCNSHILQVHTCFCLFVHTMSVVLCALLLWWPALGNMVVSRILFFVIAANCGAAR